MKLDIETEEEYWKEWLHFRLVTFYGNLSKRLIINICLDN